MTNQELSKVAQAAAYMDVLVNAGIIDKETEDFLQTEGLSRIYKILTGERE